MSDIQARYSFGIPRVSEQNRWGWFFDFFVKIFCTGPLLYYMYTDKPTRPFTHPGALEICFFRAVFLVHRIATQKARWGNFLDIYKTSFWTKKYRSLRRFFKRSGHYRSIYLLINQKALKFIYNEPIFFLYIIKLMEVFLKKVIME